MDEWDECAADWDDSDAVQAYADGAYDSLVSRAASIGLDLGGLTVCDFGCGTGLLTERLGDRCARIDAIDTSSAMLDEVRAKIDRHRWSHVRPLDRLPEPRQVYDLIVCSSVLSFVDDYEGTVSTLVSHLAVGGLFVQWDWERGPGEDESEGLLRSEIRGALEEAGLVEVDVAVAFEAAVDGETMSPLIGSGIRRP